MGREEVPQIRKQLQKDALNLAEIQHQNRHGKHMGSGLLQLCSDQSHTAFAFCQTEFALHFHTFAFVFVVLSLVSGFTFLGSSQSRTGKPDTMLLAIAEIISVSVDLVRQNAGRVMSFPLPEPFCHCLQISCFVVGIERVTLQTSPAIHNTDVQLGTKLHRFSGLPRKMGRTKGWLTLTIRSGTLCVRLSYMYFCCS